MQPDQQQQQTLIGVVEEIVFYNSENGYAVCYVQTESEQTTVVGTLPYIAVGESVTVTGGFVFHPDYGPQFKAESYEKNVPTKKEDILKYLSSGIIKGVRQSTAQKIVDYFGDQALDVIAKTPEKLARITGISKRKAAEIGQSYGEQLGVRDVVMFLQKYGVTASFAVKVYRRYGTASVDVIQTNPYILAEELYGVGFHTADRIALSMGIAPNAAIRIEAAVSFVLWEATLNGHTFLPREQLVEQTCKLIMVDPVEVDTAITSLLFSNRLHNEAHQAYESIYQPALHRAETYTAAKLMALSKSISNQPDEDVADLVTRAEREQGITLASQQRTAVQTAVEHGVCVITGGPGTGKTTIIQAILKVMDNLGKTVALAAPTGRAAKRMTELCGEEAKTLHRLLEAGYSDEQSGMQFARDDENPLECDVLIIDEMSMVDILLMHATLKALKKGSRLILVGDSDQLPSVGAGYVLRDIIASGAVPVVALTDIFRQAQESMIVVNAHNINRGEYPITNGKDSDFFLLRRESAQDIVSTIIDLCVRRLPASYGYSPQTQIQVLTPTRKGVAGVNVLNERLQAALNPPHRAKGEKQFKNLTFREGDKVMQIKNDYELEWDYLDGSGGGVGVFNGDIGYIEEISNTKEFVRVRYDDRMCCYDFSKLDELELAYAITIHKSQGSEFDAVVMPMYPCAPMLQNRNLFYTAVTRAKQLVVLVGRPDCVTKMVDNINEQRRFSGLTDKLADLKSSPF